MPRRGRNEQPYADTSPDFYLASASPRRRELLAQLRYRFAALQVDIDETPQPGETAAGLVLRLAGQKAPRARAWWSCVSAPWCSAPTRPSASTGGFSASPQPATRRLRCSRCCRGVNTWRADRRVALLQGGRPDNAQSATTVVFRPVTVAEMRGAS